MSEYLKQKQYERRQERKEQIKAIIGTAIFIACVILASIN